MSYWEGLRDRYLIGFHKWYKNRSWPLKIILLLCLVISLVVLARAGILGGSPERLARLIIPVHISWLDGEQPHIRIRFTFDITNKDNRKPGSIGSTYYSGDYLHFLLNTNQPCYMAIVGVDATGIYTLYPSQKAMEAERFLPNDEVYEIGPFPLNEVTGKEVFYAVASYRKFNINSEITPAIRKSMQNSSNAKGVDIREHLVLPEDLYHKAIYFEHRDP